MNLDNVEKLIEIVPMHYGEAIQLYPWIKDTDCEDYEWCNRTTIENSIWLIVELQKLLSGAILNEGTVCKADKEKVIKPHKLFCRMRRFWM